MLRALKKAPLPVVLLIFSFLCPTEFSLFLAGLRLPPHRVVLIVLLGFAAMRFLTRRDIHIQSFDVFFLLFNIWTVYAFSYHDGSGAGLVYGGSLALESLGAYLIARAYVRDLNSLRATLKVMLLAIAIAATVALPETFLGKNFTHDMLYALTGYHHPTAVQTRLGLTRAYGTFDHPIHYGTFCAGLLALLWFSQPEASKRRGRAALVTGATFLGISSAPLLCLILQIAMIAWERITRFIPARTLVSLVALVGLFIGIQIVSTRSVFTVIATRLTLDSWTGFYRIQIWEHGMANVWMHPWIGLGLAEWERPWWMVSSTIDAFWLVIAVREGIPAFLLLAVAIGLLGYNVISHRKIKVEPERRRLVMGWMMSLIALCLIALTVHFWNVLYAYFFFFLGLGGCLADPKVRRKYLKQRAVRRHGGHAKRNINWPTPNHGPRPATQPGLAT